MPRVKGGFKTRRRRNKILKMAKGFRGARKTKFKTAKEFVQRALQYQYRDRRNKKRDFRKLWIVRINAAARMCDISYSKLMNGLKLANVQINRKMLADLAVNDFKAFEAIANTAKAKLS